MVEYSNGEGDKGKFFGFLPTHDGLLRTEADDLDELNTNLNGFLRRLHESYPYFNFEEGIIIIWGEVVSKDVMQGLPSADESQI